MNKPVIIDGVEVSGCLAFTQEQPYLGVNCLNVLLKGGKCELNHNCYYKQLQRLNEQLKQYKQSKQASYETMQTEWNKAINESRDIKAENEKYKQALEEIREITKKYYLSDKKLLATGIMINPYNAIIEIQDRINEVLEDEM